jgi:hypothetical protein
MTPLRILILGSSYGILPATKLSLAGHKVTLVGRSEEISTIERTGIELHVPSRETESPLIVRLSAWQGECVDASQPGLLTPAGADLSQHDLIILAMQEPQFAAEEVASLMKRVADSGRPCIALMNIPPLPFLKRLPNIEVCQLRSAYSSSHVWEAFDPRLITVASPDPQAIRLDPDNPGLVLVTLPSNFKIAPFTEPAHQELLNRIAADVDAVRIATDDGLATPRVRIVAHESLFVPLAKWPMLIAGNSRCLVNDDAPRSIRDAVWSNLDESRQIYDSINSLAVEVGTAPDDLVSFDRYAAAAQKLIRPSSLARALHAGAKAVERVDLLIELLAQSKGISIPALKQVVDDIDTRLNQSNRADQTVPFAPRRTHVEDSNQQNQSRRVS